MGRTGIYRFTSNDVLLSIVILALALSSFWLLRSPSPASAQHATVYMNQQAHTIIDLNQDRVIRIPPITLEVKAGRLAIIESDCPQGICQHMHPISGPGRSLICAPNRILVTVEDGRAAVDFHSVTF